MKVPEFKLNKKEVMNFSIIFVVMLLGASIIAYGIGFLLKFPLPFVNDGIAKVNYNELQALCDKWNNIKVYTKVAVDNTSDDNNKQNTTDNTSNENNTNTTVNNQVQDDIEKFYSEYMYINRDTLETYISNNKNVIANGYWKIFIDKADINNTPTGIKTIYGDDILALDISNNIIIAGSTVGGRKSKIVILKNPKQIGLSVVDNLTYWDRIDTHAKRENALLAVNAGGYTWNDTGRYGMLYGGTKRNGDLIRRVNNVNNVVGFTSDSTLLVGEHIDKLYNAVEIGPTLIKNGQVVYKGDNKRLARTAIGQTEKGDVIIVTVDGDDKSAGATYNEVADILKKYGVVNGSALSSGSCSIMYWRGRVITKHVDNEFGIKLPTAWVIKSNK